MDQTLPSQLRHGLSLVDKLLPMAGVLGPQAVAIAKVVEGLTGVTEAILDRAEEGAIVLSSDDQAEIRAINDRLQILNDGIAQRIAQS